MGEIRDYVSQFDDYLRNTKRASENTRLSYLRDVEAFFLHLRSIPLEPVQVSTGIVRSYLDSLRAVGRSETTILRNLASIRCLYKFFIMQGYIAANPTRDIKLNHVDKKLPQILMSDLRLIPANVHKFGAGLQEVPDRPFFECVRFTDAAHTDDKVEQAVIR